MRKVTLFILSLTINYLLSAQGGGVQISAGYVPKQETSVNSKGSAITFDALGWKFIDENTFFWGLGGGIGIRSYRELPKESIINSDDPYKNYATRFDLHVGPAIGLGGEKIIACVVSPQFGFWYAGMSNDGPKVNFTTSANLDLVFGNIVSIGLTDRITSTRLVSTNWNIYNPENSYILIKPALEYRISFFLLNVD